MQGTNEGGGARGLGKGYLCLKGVRGEGMERGNNYDLI